MNFINNAIKDACIEALEEVMGELSLREKIIVETTVITTQQTLEEMQDRGVDEDE